VVYTQGRLIEDLRHIAHDASSDFWGVQARQVLDEALSYFFSTSWPWNSGEGVVTTVAPYSTGTVAVVNGSASVVGTGTTWSTGWTTPAIIRINGSSGDCIQVSSFDSTTGLTLDVAWPYTSDATATYSIEFPAHVIPGYISVTGVTIARLSTMIKLRRASFETMLAQRPWVPATFWPGEYDVRMGDGTTTQKLVLWPPPSDVRTIRFEYSKAVPPLRDYKTGTASATNANTALTGSGTNWTTAGVGYSLAGHYFEFQDQPNQQTALASVTNATTAVLVAGGWTGVTAVDTPYHISPQLLVPEDLKPLLRSIVRWKYLCRVDPDRSILAEREMRILKGQAVARSEIARDAVSMGSIFGPGWGYDWGQPPPTPSILRLET
jgi:hypothetical protein